MKLTELAGKTALVIGGSRGIGAAVTAELLSHGCDAAFTHMDPPDRRDAPEALRKTASDLGRRCLDAEVDCTNGIATNEFVHRILDAWNTLDHLVYCAGFTSPVPMEDLTIEQWRRVVDINLTGAFIAAHAVLPAMVARKKGSIVLIGSAAVTSGGGGRADYVSAKAGLEGLNRAITREYAPRGIRCNLVHPALIETDLLKQRYPDPEKRREVARQVPVGRLGQPEDVAHLVCFLLSDMADYITGQSILADGGRSFCAK